MERTGKKIDSLELYEYDPAAGGDCLDKSEFSRVDGVPIMPVFGGGIHMIPTADFTDGKCYFVHGYKRGKARDSMLVLAKIDDQPAR